MNHVLFTLLPPQWDPHTHPEVGAVINPDGESEARRGARVCPGHTEAGSPALRRASLPAEWEERRPLLSRDLISASPQNHQTLQARVEHLLRPLSASAAHDHCCPWSLDVHPAFLGVVGWNLHHLLPALSPGPTTDPLGTSSNSSNFSEPQFPQLQNGITRGLS